jgi:hypothetical protein
MKKIKTTLLLLTISLLSFSGFGQTQTYTDEQAFLDALGDVVPSKETFDECSNINNQPYPGGDFTISHEGAGTGECRDDGRVECSGGDGLYYAWNNQVKLTFNSPKNAFGTLLSDVGTIGQVTVTLMTDDGQSYTAAMSAGSDVNCNQRFFGVISDMNFIMAEFTSDNPSDGMNLDDTYCASDVPIRPIPTLSQWSIISLSVLLLIFGLIGLKQRKLILG